ncbi:NADP oxidoreductase [Streptacidiphilus pinicola]|uniref:NADP oxidoreductase n=1 Tax=Streptacidiphilus pinicola TaxID=2219663 RepID=A0A2X0KD09_9ACTN|nr:NAD(P)-binding domain-containing protein [Streptacidiphilus pinicola]RAG86955.1 NADP oxidoreductase [Streptacidiphilus pinicola]
MSEIGTTAVIGTGNIGGTLGRAFARAGHAVVFGSRNPAASEAAGDTGAKVATPEEAVAAADTVLLAIPADDVQAFLRTHADALAGKLVLDATNRFPLPVLHSADLVRAMVPTARYARAFNSQAWETFADPRWDGEPGHLFYTVFDAADAPTVEALISAVGLVPAFAGLGRPDLLDAALFLMVPAYETHGRRTGLRLVHD